MTPQSIYYFSDNVDSNGYLYRIKNSEKYSLILSNQFNNAKYSMDLSKEDLLNFASFIQQSLQDQQ